VLHLAPYRKQLRGETQIVIHNKLTTPDNHQITTLHQCVMPLTPYFPEPDLSHGAQTAISRKSPVYRSMKASQRLAGRPSNSFCAKNRGPTANPVRDIYEDDFRFGNGSAYEISH
jgi:hypothetical protein